MSDEPRKAVYATDPNTWPVVECVPTDVFLGSFVHDCTPHLTDEQKAWPVVECVPTDVFLDPVLTVALTVRAGADAGAVALGMAELLRALSAREEALGGSGLLYDGRASRHDGENLRVVLYPKTEAGAQKRLRKLAELIDSAPNQHPVIPRAVVGEGGSFTDCHATA